jgi:gamma-glutamyltranspeptidase/glutathione hydrolase
MNTKDMKTLNAHTLRATLFVIAGAALAPMALAVSQPPLESTNGMVVTTQRTASEVGATVLRQGGNAIDAAVAIGYALAVTHPTAGNVGGGGFMTIHLANGKDTFINFREKAPHAATATMYQDAKGNPIPSKSLDGYLAVGIPGTVLGLETARKEYGTMSLEALITPAIGLAETGFMLVRGDIDDFDEESTAQLLAQPNIAAIFLPGGKLQKPGDRLIQHNLAATLKLIRDGGPDAFYKGPIAAAVVAASQANGGILTKADFANFTISETTPITCQYRGYTIVSAPPPSSGGVVLCQMFKVIEPYPLGEYGYHSSAELHVMTEAMRNAYFDRNTYLGDPAFVNNPIERLLSPAHIEEIRARIKPHQATPSSTLSPVAAPNENRNTTHYSVLDKFGNAVSVTYTLNNGFGAKVMAGDTGFILNDEMDDFSAKPGAPNMYGLIEGTANAIAPGKQPLSSMSPTVVLKDGKPFLVLGAPGGSRIITTVFEVIVNIIDHGMTLQEAIDAPRVHHQWLPDTIGAEPFALSADTTSALTHMGYKVVPLENWGSGNSTEIIGVAPADLKLARKLGFPRAGIIYGAADSRDPSGSPAAP